MASEMSKTQIDRLGDRLKKGSITEADLRLLDLYRRSFTEEYEIVVGAIREKLTLEPTGRPAKSTTSISEKLRRESIRLTQIQDIAGCRLTVSDIAMQDSVVQSLKSLFGQTVIVIDRRQQPSHGYRAVHVVINVRGKLIEIQVRTELQHLWAELSEKFSDVIDPAIKYGAGDNKIRAILKLTSETVAREESIEPTIESMLADRLVQGGLPDTAKEALDIHENQRQLIFELLRVLIDSASNLGLRGERDDLSN